MGAACNIGFEDFIPHLQITYEELKKLHEESKKRRAEKQKLKAQINPQSLLDHGPTESQEEQEEQEEHGERSSPDPEIIELEDDD